MATAAVATSPSLSSDPRDRLRADKMAEQKRRQQSGFSIGNLPGVNRARAAMLGLSMLNATPQLPTDASDNAPQTENISGGDAYREAFNKRQMQAKIGPSVGLDLKRQPTEYDYDAPLAELDDIEQDLAARETQALMRNQSGEDQRSTSAKREDMNSMREQAFQIAMESIQDKFGKEFGALGVNLLGDTVEGFDWGEDFGLSDGVVFVQRQAQAVRTILDPEKSTSGTPKNVQELKAKLQNNVLDIVIPRFDLKSLKGISGLLGEIWIWFAIGIVTLVLATFILIIYAMLNPTSTMWGLQKQHMLNVITGQSGFTEF